MPERYILAWEILLPYLINSIVSFNLFLFSSHKLSSYTKTSLVVQMVKRLSTMWETRVQALGWEDPLEKEMANPQYYCLENPMDRGAWQATVYGVTKSRTPLNNYINTYI